MRARFFLFRYVLLSPFSARRSRPAVLGPPFSDRLSFYAPFPSFLHPPEEEPTACRRTARSVLPLSYLRRFPSTPSSRRARRAIPFPLLRRSSASSPAPSDICRAGSRSPTTS